MTVAALKASWGLCTVKGCLRVATRPCTCSPELCEDHYAAEMMEAENA